MVGLLTPVPPIAGARAKGCYACAHNHGLQVSTHVVCERDAERSHVVGIARSGCAFWEREPGADDE